MAQSVFVVEDDTDIQSVLVEALAGEGYDATGYDSAAAALAAIERRPPDLLITDLAMPGMRGEELVARVRSGAGAGIRTGAEAGSAADAADTSPAELPILIISATANARAVAHLPVQGFIGKPFELTDLLAQVARWIREAGGVPASVSNPAYRAG